MKKNRYAMPKKYIDRCVHDIIMGESGSIIIDGLTEVYLAHGYQLEKAKETAITFFNFHRDVLITDGRLVKHDTSCTVDLDNKYEIILHIRDLFIKKLNAYGWGEKQIHEFITKAGTNTNFEHAQNSEGERVVPRCIPERGDRNEYNANKFRLSK